MHTLRTLTPDEFPLLVPHGRAFFEEYRGFLDTDRFDDVRFLESMQSMAQWCGLTVFGLWDEERFIGGLAAYIQPDLFSTETVSRDVFVYIEPQSRGGMNIRRLLNAYHMWAREKGCRHAYMVHLLSGPLQQKFEKVYRSYGYEPMETAYRIDLESLCPF